MGHRLPSSSLDAIASHLQPQLPTLDGPSAARFLYACSASRHAPGPFLSALCNAMAARLAAERPHHPAAGDKEDQGAFLASLAFGLGCVAARSPPGAPPPAPAALLVALEDAALRRRNAFDPMQLAGAWERAAKDACDCYLRCQRAYLLLVAAKGLKALQRSAYRGSHACLA